MMDWRAIGSDSGPPAALSVVIPSPARAPYPITDLLLVTLIIAALCTLLNIPLLVVPPSRREAMLWRRLQLQKVRRWLTRRRHVNQPLSPQTATIARQNILWHLILSAVMCGVMIQALQTDALLYKLFGALSVLPCVAWLLGSLVQRQKIVLLHLVNHPA